MVSTPIALSSQGELVVPLKTVLRIARRLSHGRLRAHASRQGKDVVYSLQRMSLRVVLGWAAACGALWLAALGHAQTIRIPDFRQEASAVVKIRPGEACNTCGRIVSLQESQVEGNPNVPPAFRSGTPGSSTGGADSTLVGAVIVLPLGNEGTEKPFVGGVGTPEMRERFRETIYKMTVRLDDGALRFLQRYDGYRFRVGDRVRLSGVDQIELIAE